MSPLRFAVTYIRSPFLEVGLPRLNVGQAGDRQASPSERCEIHLAAAAIYLALRRSLTNMDNRSKTRTNTFAPGMPSEAHVTEGSRADSSSHRAKA